MGNPTTKPIDDQEKALRNPIETELHELLSRKNSLPKAMSGASLYMTHFSLQFSNQPIPKYDSTCFTSASRLVFPDVQADQQSSMPAN
jgi:hypothetical protein